MFKIHQHLTVLLLLVAGWPCLASPPEAPKETIAFTTLRPANQDIYLVDGKDSEPRPITDHPALDYNPAFSSNGRWLVFTSERSGNADLHALDLKNGGDPVRLTRNRGMDDAADISRDGDRIVFVSSRDGHADIFVMPFRPDAPVEAEEAAVNLTRDSTGDFQPAFSPDGSTIAFARQLDQADIQLENTARAARAQSIVTHIHLMDADGSNRRRLVGEVPFRMQPGVRIFGAPAWSRDGEVIYFHTAEIASMMSGPEWSTDIWQANVNDSDARPSVQSESLHMLTPVVSGDDGIVFHGQSPLRPRQTPSYKTGTIHFSAKQGTDPSPLLKEARELACFSPAVGPDGQIACHGPGPIEDLVPKADGNPLLRPGTQATVDLPDRTVELVGMHGYFPDFLPDGRLAYGESLPQTGYVEDHGIPPIVTSRIDGSGRRVVLDSDSLGGWATSTCRQDGRIAFNAGPDFAPVDAPVDIWTMQPDGTELKNLTDDDTSNDAFPAWSSDCEHIVFRSGRDGNKEIYIMEDDGANPRRLTRHPATDTAPHISPDGEWIVFATGRERLDAEDGEQLDRIGQQGYGGGAGYRLLLQRLDGSERRFLEPDLVGVTGRDMHPRFSPDGKWILFISGRSGMNDEWLLSSAPQPYGELWAIPFEGGDAIRLTQDKWENGLARWGRKKTLDEVSCTQVLGFSQSLEWYGGLSLADYMADDGPPKSPSLETGVFLPNWQGAFYVGASVEKWLDPGFLAWSGNDGTTHEVATHCDRDQVDRVVFNVSGEARPADEWASIIESVAELIRENFPAVRQIVMQPVVGAPDGACQEVLAARNHPDIAEGIRKVAQRGMVEAGPEPKVATCDQFRDGLGHLTKDGARHVRNMLENHYRDEATLPEGEISKGASPDT